MNSTTDHSAPFLLAKDDYAFPDPALALTDPDGLLAIGGDLAPARLITAYRFGIFPWYSEGQPILWWSPNPRSILTPDSLHISRSLQKRLRRQTFQVTFDQAFANVIQACAQPRPDQPGTWITPAMQQAYIELNRLGYAHSIEAWHEGELVGGLYGIALGRAFFGESMFSRRTDASKVAFVHLAQQLSDWGFELIDCQVASEHLQSLGAHCIDRTDFLQRLDVLCIDLAPQHHWHSATPRWELARP